MIFDKNGKETEVDFYYKDSEGTLKKMTGDNAMIQISELRTEAAGRRRSLRDARLKLDALGDMSHEEIIQLQVDSHTLQAENEQLKQDKATDAIFREFTESAALRETIYGKNPAHAQRIWGDQFELNENGKVVHKTLKDEITGFFMSVDEAINHKLNNSPNADSYKLSSGQRGSNNQNQDRGQNNSSSVDALANTIDSGGMEAFRKATG